LFVANRRMFGRLVAKPPQPDNCPNDAEHSKQPKTNLPAEFGLERDDDERRECATQAAGAPHQTLSAASFGGGEPAADAARGIWRCAGFTRTEQEPDRDQHVIVAGERLERG